MNKIAIIFLLLIGSKAFGETVPTIILLETFSHRGALIDKDIAIIKDGSIVVNKEKLSPSEVITQSEHITKLADFKSGDASKRCETGIFKHILSKGKIQKLEKGCIDSDRYKLLKENFRALKKDHVTQ